MADRRKRLGETLDRESGGLFGTALRALRGKKRTTGKDGKKKVTKSRRQRLLDSL